MKIRSNMKYLSWLVAVLALFLAGSCSDSSNDDDDDDGSSSSSYYNGNYYITLATSDCAEVSEGTVSFVITVNGGNVTGTVDLDVSGTTDVTGTITSGGELTMNILDNEIKGVISRSSKYDEDATGKSFVEADVAVADTLVIGDNSCSVTWTGNYGTTTKEFSCSGETGNVAAFNGKWDLNLNLAEAGGSCAAFTGDTGSYSMSIANGVISGTASTNLGDLAIGGTVDASGTATISLNTSLGAFEFPGTLDATTCTGAGTWEVAILAGCTGDWDATQTSN